MPPKILIVDDDHDTHAYIADLLEVHGYEADCVHHTHDAREVIVLEQPALVILDLHIDRRYAGWTLLQELRADPATATIPVILVTSDRDFVRSQQTEAQAHAATLLEKPFQHDDLITLVESRLGV